MQHYKKCLGVDMLFEGGRMAVGAISVAYVLSTGIPQDQIAYLKIVQGAILLVGELPTGVFADAFGHKKSLWAACACSIAGLLLYAFSTSFILFAAGESLLALALCFWSGAYEAFSIETCALENADQKGRMDRFFHHNQSLTSFSVLALGWVGGYVGKWSFQYAYFIAIAFMAAAAGLLSLIPDSHAPVKDDASRSWVRRMVEHAAETNGQIARTPILLPFVAANIVLQFSIQPLLHYWQPFFAQLDGSDLPARLGEIFAAYCGASILFSFAFARVSTAAWARSKTTTLTLFLIFAIFYYLFGHATALLPAAVFFVVLQGTLSVARTSLGIRLNEILPSKHRAALLSTVGLISRVGMMSALATVGHFLGTTSTAEGLTSLMRSFGLGTFLALGLLALGTALSNVLRKR